MNIIAVTQARIGSSRLPAKVLREVGGISILQIHLERLKKSRRIQRIIVATTNEPEAIKICDIAQNLSLSFYRGSMDDVLDRFYNAVKEFNPDWVVRITSDCPLIDPKLIDNMIAFTLKSDADYISNTIVEQYPDGQDIEIFKFGALEKAWKGAVLKSDREHVTPFIKRNSDIMGGSIFKAFNFPCDGNFSKIRITLDEEKDYVVIKKLIDDLGTDKSWLEYTNYIIDNNLHEINSGIVRNEGYIKSLKND